MKQKILQHSLQKISPQDRCVWGALIIALAVHLLLALLFRHTPAQNSHDSSESPKVGSIVLSNTENAGLAVWMKNHDPAVMTVPDKVLGYSAVLGNEKPRSEPEDLPNLVQPVIPQKSPETTEVAKLKISIRGVLQESMIPQIYKVSKARPAVTLNGEYAGKISEILLAVLKADAVKLPENQDKISDTALEIQPERLPGTGARVVLIRRSGSEALDAAAQKTLYKYMLTNDLPENFYGKLLFIWSNVKYITENNRKQAI